MEENLLLEAVNTPYTEWMSILDLIEKAEDDVLKERLRRIMIEKHHAEEYYTGNL